MTFDRTQDPALIRSIIAHPKVYPYVTDDNAPAVEEFQPTEHPAICYVTAHDGADLLGMWCFIPHNSVCWEVHTYMLPGHGFRRSRTAAREVAAWIFANTSCQRIFTNVPEYNRIALKYAQDAGMVEFGRNPQSFLKNGQLWTQVLLGLSRLNSRESAKGTTLPAQHALRLGGC